MLLKVGNNDALVFFQTYHSEKEVLIHPGKVNMEKTAAVVLNLGDQFECVMKFLFRTEE